VTTHRTVTCDRCSAVIPERVFLRVVTRYVRRDPTTPSAGLGGDYDLCEECEVAFKTWLAETPDRGGS
jgi:hypothetical protein